MININGTKDKKFKLTLIFLIIISINPIIATGIKKYLIRVVLILYFSNSAITFLIDKTGIEKSMFLIKLKYLISQTYVIAYMGRNKLNPI